MFWCMYVNVYICACTCLYVVACVCACERACVHVCVRAYVRHACACMLILCQFECICRRTYVYGDACMRVSVGMHVHIWVCVLVCVFTCMYIREQVWTWPSKSQNQNQNNVCFVCRYRYNVKVIWKQENILINGDMEAPIKTKNGHHHRATR